MKGYVVDICSKLHKDYYYPREAALRWVGLIEHEKEILAQLGDRLVPEPGEFKCDCDGGTAADGDCYCFAEVTKKIFTAIKHGKLRCGRDNATVSAEEWKKNGVTVSKQTVLHDDLKQWVIDANITPRPAFLFDELERGVHSAITLETFQVLESKCLALSIKLEAASSALEASLKSLETTTNERDRLAKKIKHMDVPDGNTESTYLSLVAALVNLINEIAPKKNVSGKVEESSKATRMVMGSDAKIRDWILTEYPIAGFSDSSFDGIFKEAKIALREARDEVRDKADRLK